MALLGAHLIFHSSRIRVKKGRKLHDGQDMWRIWGRIELYKGCWWGCLRERGHWGDQDTEGRIILRWIFRKLGG
jgi:hypothetical protein